MSTGQEKVKTSVINLNNIQSFIIPTHNQHKIINEVI